MDLRDLAPLCDHALCVNGGRLHLAADRSVHDGSNLLDHLVEISAFLCDQRRVRGNAADDTHVIRLLNVLNVRCVNEKFHSVYSPF